MITFQQLTKCFGAQVAVDALSFEIPAGQIVGFLGPNGAETILAAATYSGLSKLLSQERWQPAQCQ